MRIQGSKVVKFIVSGGGAATVEYGLFAILSVLHTPLVIAHTVSFLCGLIISFTLNKVWVFSSRGNIKRQLISYGILASVNIVIGNCFIWILVEHSVVHALLAKLIVMSALSLWNYLFFLRIIFKPSPL